MGSVFCRGRRMFWILCPFSTLLHQCAEFFLPFHSSLHLFLASISSLQLGFQTMTQEREGERDRQTDRETDTHTQRQRQKETDRQRQRQRQKVCLCLSKYWSPGLISVYSMRLSRHRAPYIKLLQAFSRALVFKLEQCLRITWKVC